MALLKLAADENFHNDIVRGLRRRNPSLDLIRIQDVSVVGQEDPAVLEWAAQEGRILLTHDVNTIPGFAFERVRDGLPMPGVFLVSQHHAIGSIIGDLLLLAECSLPGEWMGRVIYVPLE